ncbi:MAG: hypothetical protein JRG74_14680 [Deltaproteobacteria bacterium]|nr:hypothetical protein [Deltaproteobacteria bacterium]
MSRKISANVRQDVTRVFHRIFIITGGLNIPYSYQVVKKSGVDRLINGIRIVSADRFLCGLI